MLTINGKTLLYTDIHYGKKQNSVRWLDTCSTVSNKIAEYIKENDVKNVIFAGDYLDQRESVSVQTLLRAYEDLEKVSENVNYYFIVGNHDMFNKNSNDIVSPKVFKNIRNVNIINDPIECMLNGKYTLLCPFVYDETFLKKLKDNTYDMMIGHFDISPKFMEEIYKRLTKKNQKTSSNLAELLMNDSLLEEMGVAEMNFEIETKKNKTVAKNPYYWTDALKEGGVIYSGHIHQRTDSMINGRRIVLIGSPYQQTRQERDMEAGFYVLDSNNNDEFVQISNTPKFIEVKMSEIVNDMENYDFSKLEGNIVHKVYDVEINKETDSKITQIISDRKPYEELTPEYLIVSRKTENGMDSSESLKLMRKSTVDYIFSYIDNMEEKYIKEHNLDRAYLKKLIRENSTEGNN